MKKKRILCLVLALMLCGCGKKAQPSVSAPSPSSSASPEVQYEDIPVDFAFLQAQHPDIIGWITVGGTSINDVIAQSEEDDFYLRHDLDGNYSVPGTYYINKEHKKDFSTNGTVIYGHHLTDGSRFSDLEKYDDEEFLKNNREITIYTPDRVKKYQIFSAVIFSDVYIPDAYDFSNWDETQKYLQDIKASTDSRSHTLDDVTITQESSLLILSTCEYAYPPTEKRRIITAVQVSDKQGRYKAS